MKLWHYPLRQGVGAPAVPVVQPGDHVRRGALIAAAPADALGAPIHASVTGLVRSTEGTIVIEGERAEDYEKLAPAAPLSMLRASGLIGLGGAGFPTWMKYRSPLPAGGTVIVNAAECEPILSHNLLRAERQPDGIVRGLCLAMDLAQAAHGVIAIKAIHTAAVRALETAIAHGAGGRDISLHLLRNLYPMGEERALVREVLGRLLPVTALPLEAGAIVSNAETIYRLHEAVDLGKPLIDKDLTVAGKLRAHPGEILPLLDVPIGRSVAAVFADVGGLPPEDSYGELLMGGPFTGHRTTPSAPVVKTTGGLIAAECFPKGPARIGLLICACSADEVRLREVAASLGSEVAGVACCKQALPVKAARKCQNPGICPGQVAKILALKKAGAEAVLIGNCTDCTNTVMSCAPQLGLPVYHVTDQALRAVNERLIRKIHEHIA